MSITISAKKRIYVVVNGLVTIPTVIFRITINCNQDNEHNLINKMAPFYVIIPNEIYFILLDGCYKYFIHLGFLMTLVINISLIIYMFSDKHMNTSLVHDYTWTHYSILFYMPKRIKTQIIYRLMFTTS